MMVYKYVRRSNDRHITSTSRDDITYKQDLHRTCMQMRACYLRTAGGLAHCSHTWKTNSKVFQTKVHRIINKTGTVHIQETLWRVSLTTVAVEKHEVLHILSVCL